MTAVLRVYLAGPEVFLPDPYAAATAKKALCAEHGFEGVFPLDGDFDARGLEGRAVGSRIAAANEALMRACDLLIANMTPFRGPGMDGGTAYEMGFMRALGRPVFGYTNRPGHFAARTRAWLDAPPRRRQDGGEEDADGLLIEDFGMADNLMMAAAVSASGGVIEEQDGRLDALEGFAACLVQARTVFGRQG